MAIEGLLKRGYSCLDNLFNNSNSGQPSDAPVGSAFMSRASSAGSKTNNKKEEME